MEVKSGSGKEVNRVQKVHGHSQSAKKSHNLNKFFSEPVNSEHPFNMCIVLVLSTNKHHRVDFNPSSTRCRKEVLLSSKGRWSEEKEERGRRWPLVIFSLLCLLPVGQGLLE